MRRKTARFRSAARRRSCKSSIPSPRSWRRCRSVPPPARHRDGRKPAPHRARSDVHRPAPARRHRRPARARQAPRDRRRRAFARRIRAGPHQFQRRNDRAVRLDAAAAGRGRARERDPLHRHRVRGLHHAGVDGAALHAPHRRHHQRRREPAALPRAARPALRPAEPQLLRRAPRSRDHRRQERRPAGGGVLHRPRSFQGRQRHARPSDRRRTDPQRDDAALGHGARRRPGRPARRRRVRDHHLGLVRPRRAADRRDAHHLQAVLALLDQRPHHRDRRQHRHRGDEPALGERSGRHPALCRHGALPRQERGPQPRLHLRRGDGRRPVQPQAARKRPARGDRERQARRALPADRQRQRRDRDPGRGAGALAASDARRDLAGRVHSDRRALRPDHRARRQLCCAGPASTPRPGRASCSRSTSRRCSSGSSISST